MAAFFKIFLLLFIGLVLCSETFAQNGRGRGNVNRINRNGLTGGAGGGRRAYASMGAMGAMGAGLGRGRRYRSVLYNDDDVYGYEASYPNGEALYINYKSSEARAKRAPEFARSSPYSSGGQGFSGLDQGEMGYDAPPDFGFQ